MHNKIVKIAIFLLRSKALNDIIKHIFSLAVSCAAGEREGLAFSRVLI